MTEGAAVIAQVRIAVAANKVCQWVYTVGLRAPQVSLDRVGEAGIVEHRADRAESGLLMSSGLVQEYAHFRERGWCECV